MIIRCKECQQSEVHRFGCALCDRPIGEVDDTDRQDRALLATMAATMYTSITHTEKTPDYSKSRAVLSVEAARAILAEIDR